ncbi:MAG TPA: nucleoside monophosphate kinase [Candidatus Saccharimonadales bacterium]|nr:nucleoside monophosphate kinase [Candidatus Saccharimonadales bacterium]
MILLMGLAGSGKGTQGKLLSEKLDYEYISTGDYLRQYLSEERKSQILAGKLVDDNEMIRIIDDFLSSAKKESILDGFPRSEEQANWLLQKHNKDEINIEALIYLKVSREELIDRLLARGRADDNEEAIKTRFEEYSRATSPIIENYKKKGIKIIEVNGSGTVDNIHKNILKQLNK